MIHGQTVPKELTITGLMKPAQSTGKGRFSGPIVANDTNYLSLCSCKADVVQNGSLLIAKGYIFKFQDRIWNRRKGMVPRRENIMQIDRSKAHMFSSILRQLPKCFRRKDLHDFPVFQIHNPVHQIHQIVQPMFCNQYGFSLRFDQPEMFSQFLNGTHIQIGGRFIQKIYLRIHRIDRGKCYLLLFSTG